MKTAADIVRDLSELLDAVSDLLDVEGLKTLVHKLARTVGFEAQLNIGVDAMADVLTSLRETFTEWIEPLRHVDGLRGLVLLLQPFVEVLGNVIESVGNGLAGLGLDGLQAPEPITQGIQLAADALGSGADFIAAGPPSADDVLELTVSLADLTTSVIEFRIVP